MRFTCEVNVPAGVTVTTDPIYIPDARPDGFTVTVTTPVASEMAACSQFWPVVVVDETLLIVTREPLKVMLTT